MKKEEKALLFEMGRKGRRGSSTPPAELDTPSLEDVLPASKKRGMPLDMPELSEVEIMRHYTALSHRNFGVDSGFYPLGSCTMKYNPKINEETASLPGLSFLHPCQEEETVQGALELLWQLERMLGEITGMERFTFQPAAGAHGELTGLMIILAYLRARGEKRSKVLVPFSAHGTNPASGTMAGLKVVQIPSDQKGLVDVGALKEALDEETAALMLTNPNTLGLFEENIQEIARLVHEAGALLYYDGANLNPIMGMTRPGDMGFDVVHLNLHKTFSAPHGGGGPGSGPVGVKKDLAPYLPVPLVEKSNNGYYLQYELPHSIGKVHGFHGNFGVAVKAYTYLRMMGKEGLKQVSQDAVLNANYLMKKVQDHYRVPHNRPCKHEFVISAKAQKKQGVGAADIAKSLLDYGYHPPIVYFPLEVDEALMVEPTETEGKETLDRFAEALGTIARLAAEDPGQVQAAPLTTPVKRLDEVRAIRQPRLRWQKEEDS